MIPHEWAYGSSHGRKKKKAGKTERGRGVGRRQITVLLFRVEHLGLNKKQKSLLFKFPIRSHVRWSVRCRNFRCLGAFVISSWTTSFIFFFFAQKHVCSRWQKSYCRLLMSRCRVRSFSDFKIPHIWKSVLVCYQRKQSRLFLRCAECALDTWSFFWKLWKGTASVWSEWQHFDRSFIWSVCSLFLWLSAAHQSRFDQCQCLPLI